MWDHPIKSCHTSAERARHPLHNHRSVYMSCLSGASSNTALQEQHQLSSPLGHYTKNHLSISGAGNSSNVSGSPKGYRKVDSGSASSTMWSRNISNNKPDMLGYSISDISQQSGRGSVYDLQVLKSPLAQNFENSNNALCISRRDFSSKNPVSTFSSGTARSTASHIQHQGSNLREFIDEGGRTSMPSYLCRQEKVDYLRSMEAFSKNLRNTDTISKQGECNHQSDSTVLLSKKKLDMCSTFTKSLMPMSRKNDGSFLMLDIHRPAFGPLEEIHLSGAKSSLIDKDMISVKSPSTDAFASSGKGVRRKRVIPEIPDLNIALSDLPDAEDVMGNSDPSTNRTKCLGTTSLHAVQPSSTSRGIKRRKTSASGSISKYPSAQGMEKTEDASGSISFGTKILNLGDSHPHEILNRSSRKFREGGLNKSELTFSGKEVIMLDSDEGPASVMISESSSKEMTEVEKNIASDKNAKSPSAQGMEKTEDASVSVSFGTRSLNLGDSHLDEILNRSFRKFREGVLNKSELTFAGKEVIMLDSDDGQATVSGSSPKELIEVEKNTASDKNAKSPSAQGMEQTEDASGSISFGTESLNLGDSNPHEIVNRSFRKFREGGLNMSELKFAGKEVIVLDSDDDADDGPASVTISGSSSKEVMEVEKNIASDKNGKSPSAQGMEKTEEVTRLWPKNWPLYPPAVRRTAQENPEPTLVHSPQISCVALETIRERKVPSTVVAMDVITSVSNKQQIVIQEKVQNNKL